MYVLHKVFLPRINKVLDSFTSGWNKYPLRTEKNWSPQRIWTNGVIDARNRHLTAVSDMHAAPVLEDLEWFGFDTHAPSPGDEGLSTGEVNDVLADFSVEESKIISHYDVMRNSQNFGIDIYLELCELLNI